MNVEEARQLAKEKIEELGQELERGHSETLRAYLAAMAKFPRYSPNNIWLILAQAPQSRQVAGFGTWKRLGRYVRKGEHGIAILAPCVKRRNPDGVRAKPKRDMPAGHEDADTDEVVVGFRGAYVFDVSQTAGAPLADLAIVAGNPSVYTDRLKAFVAEYGMVIEYSWRIAPARGACTGKTIVLVPDMPPAEHLSTLAHELGHALLHRRDGREGLSRTVRETEAEAVAFVVCEAIGLESRSSSADYIQLWNGDVKTLTASLERVQKTAAQIIAAIGPDV